jgi:SAM-dependent methyltransferase
MKSWSFFGGPGSPSYRLFDYLRMLVNRSLVSYFLKHAINRAECKVLEAGSGPGYASSLCARAQRVTLVVAVDFDIDALRQGRNRDPSLPAVVADVRKLPFRSDAFDLVWNSSTVEHLDDPSTAVSEMQRVTSKYGYVFVGVPYRNGPLGFQRWIARSSAGIWIGQVFGHRELQSLLQRSGLEVVGTRLYFFWFFIGMLATRR